MSGCLSDSESQGHGPDELKQDDPDPAGLEDTVVAAEKDALSAIPVLFARADSEQTIGSIRAEEIGDIMQEYEFAWGKVFIFTGSKDENNVYGGYLADGQYYVLGQIGERNDVMLETVQLWGRELVKLLGVYGANAPVTNYFKISEGKLEPFLKVDTGNVTELDLDEDGVSEIVSQHGTFSMTLIYRWEAGQWEVANLNEALNADAVMLDPERKLFYAHFRDGSKKRFAFTPTGMQETDIDIKIQFPEQVPLSYGTLDHNSRWKYDEPQESWQLVNSFEGQGIDGQPLTIQFFKEENNLHAWIQYLGSTTLQMFVGYSEEEISFTSLQTSVEDDWGARHMLGCIVSTALPGRCLEYHPALDEWIAYSIWGELAASDFDGDGIVELWSRFDGRGNNPPDVGLMRWDGEAWEEVWLATEISRQINDIYWKAAGHRLVVVPNKVVHRGREEIWFVAIASSEEQNAVYKLGKGTDLLERIK